MNERRVNDVELPPECMREMPERCLPSPLWGGSARSAGVGVVVVVRGAAWAINSDPHPARLARDPPHKGEGKERAGARRDGYRAVVLPGCSAVVPGAGAGGVTGAAAAAAGGGVPAGLIQQASTRALV
jgi:hypothetical protein